MKPERILLQRRLYDEARKRPEAELRAFLDQACGEDRQLREDLEKLLGMATSPGSEGGTGGVPPTVWGEDSILDGFLSPPGRPGSLGRVGHYDVEEVIGQGSFGVVMRARDETLLWLVAIKTLQHSADAATRLRFLREARAIAAVPSNEYVIRIHEVGEDPAPFLVMEYINGPTLQQKLDQNGPLGQKEALRIGQQTALGLAAAHKAGLVHRDIKPANILLENHIERVKITDFGLACETTDATLSQPTRIKGTPDYMSPEQANGKTVDHRSDLFSLGSVLYAMVTGQSPFRTGRVDATLSLVKGGKHRPVREANREISDRLCEIIERLLQKHPRERFQTAGEVAELLGAELARLQGPPPDDTTGVDLKIRTDDADDSFASGELPARWWPIPLALAAIAAIVIGAFRWEALIAPLAWTIPAEAPGAAGLASGEAEAPQPTLLAAATSEIAVTEPDSADRRAAEWVIQQGGAVILHGGGGEIADLAGLPAGRFSLQWVYFRRKPVGNDGLRRLRPLREIQGIDASGTGVTDAGLKHIAEKTGLLYLFIADNAITDRGLERLKGLSRLQMLGLHDTGVSDRGMMIVGNLRDLSHLYLSRTQVGDAGLARLAGLKGLKEIRLDETKITADGLRALRGRLGDCKIVGDPGRVDPARIGIRQGDPDREIAEWVLKRGGTVRVHEGPDEIADLEHLPKSRFSVQWVYFKHRPVDVEGFRKLKSLRILQGIEANSTGLTDEGLKHIAEIKGLFYLFISDNPVSDEGVEHLAGLRKMKMLYLADTGVTDRAMATIETFADLGYLYLSRTQVGDAGLARLAGLKGLQELRLDETKVTADGLSRFKQAVPACKVEEGAVANASSGRSSTPPAVANQREIADWVFENGGSVVIHEGKPGEEIMDPKDLPRGRFTIQVINFRDRRIGDEGVQKIKRLPRLQGLGVSSMGITDRGMSDIGEMKDLVWLFLDRNPITDEGLRSLQGLKSLGLLSVQHTEITDKGMRFIRDHRNLGNLFLAGTSITDDGLALLSGLKNLQRVRLRGTRVTADGIRKFEKQLPNCVVDTTTN